MGSDSQSGKPETAAEARISRGPARGEIQNVLKKRISFPCDKGPLVGDWHGHGVRFSPREAPENSGACSSQSLAGVQRPAFGGGGTRLNRSLSKR